MRANFARHAARRAALVRRRAAALPCTISASSQPYSILTHRAPLRHDVARPILANRRTFLTSILQKPPRDVRETEYEPGWLEIMVWRGRVLDNLQPPPLNDLAKAWSQLMEYKSATGRPLNSTQALQCRRLLPHLVAKNREGDAIALSHDALTNTFDTLQRPLEEASFENHKDLADALLRYYDEGTLGVARTKHHLQVFETRIHFMIKSGASTQALSQCKALLSKTHVLGKSLRKALHAVAQGLADEGKEDELLQLVDFLEASDEYTAYIQRTLFNYYATRDHVEQAKLWFSRDARTDDPTAPAKQYNIYNDAAAFASRNGLDEWLRPHIEKLADMRPHSKFRRAIGTSLLILGDDLETVLETVTRASGEPPDIRTYNVLLRVAADMKDEELANALTAMAADQGLQPDDTTFQIWLDMKLRTGEVEGATYAFEKLRYSLAPDALTSIPHQFSRRNEYERLLSVYLDLLTSQKRPDFRLITEVLEHCDEMQLILGAEAVAKTCIAFLENEQFFDAMDLLALQAFKYGEDKRRIIQVAAVEFCLDSTTSTARAWASYQILEQYFPDLEKDDRVKLMESFFARKRPDMACKVFGHMRNHRSKAYHPEDTIYIKCLEGLATYPDLEGVHSVHNWLKLDTNIQPSTRLFTALMLAYTGAGRPLIALDYWKEITSSREGPGYRSLEAVFWASEKRPNGVQLAREIWERIERMDIEVTTDVYNAYIGAIAGSGLDVEAQKAITNMASYVGSEPEPLTLGIAYNALPGQALQQSFQEWAKSKYRTQWAELMKVGRRMNEHSLCQFKIKREFKA